MWFRWFWRIFRSFLFSCFSRGQEAKLKKQENRKSFKLAWNFWKFRIWSFEICSKLFLQLLTFSCFPVLHLPQHETSKQENRKTFLFLWKSQQTLYRLILMWFRWFLDDFNYFLFSCFSTGQETKVEKKEKQEINFSN